MSLAASLPNPATGNRPDGGGAHRGGRAASRRRRPVGERSVPMDEMRLMEREQCATHGLAWFATYVQAIRQLASDAERMARDGRLARWRGLLVRTGAAGHLGLSMLLAE